LWLYNNIVFTPEDSVGYYGFVYIIKNTLTGRAYIGRKYFSKSSTKQVKGKRKKIRKSSDWENYWSSSEELKKEVEEYGKENFTRTILYLCKTRSECSYLETYEIFKNNALLSDNYINAWVSCRIHKSHVKGKVWPKSQQPALQEHKDVKHPGAADN
jgi:hypothetical protein